MLLSCYRAVGDVDALQRVARLTLARSETVLAHDPKQSARCSVTARMRWPRWAKCDRTTERMDRALLVDPDNLNMRYDFAVRCG